MTVRDKQSVARTVRGLTQKQEAFSSAYIETGNGSEAYRRVYKPKRASAKTINEESCKLLANPKIATRVAELRKTAAERAGLTLQKHLDKLAELRDLAVQSGGLDSAIRAETKRGEASGFYPSGRAVNVSVAVSGNSEPMSETSRWLEEVTVRDVEEQK